MMFSSSHPAGRHPRRNHVVPLLVSAVLGAAAIGAVAYLLQPTWTAPDFASEPDTLPVMVGNTLFNVPTQAVRVKLQKRTGPQERVDLAFLYPSLEAPQAQPHVTASTIGTAAGPIDRIFVSVIAHHNAISPSDRVNTIYPRYLESTSSNVQDTLMTQAFREGTPYAGEDLFLGDGLQFVARCTRDASTPGMCMSERRVGDADIDFRFPRAWLAKWRDVSDAMDQLTTRMTSTAKP